MNLKGAEYDGFFWLLPLMSTKKDDESNDQLGLVIHDPHDSHDYHGFGATYIHILYFPWYVCIHCIYVCSDR